MQTLRDNAATPPDALNEDWRFGRPHVHAAELLRQLHEQPGDAGCVELLPPGSLEIKPLSAPADELPSIGSGYLVRQLLSRPMQRLALSLNGSSTAEQPAILSCKANGFFVAELNIIIESGSQVHIVERHEHTGASSLICLRRYTVMPGASLTLELREEGSGSSRAMNISHITCLGDSQARHITCHSGHSWAREETTADLQTKGEASPDLQLLSANYLQGAQVLDQRTVQHHTTPGAHSRLLYKNVVDDQATAVYGGNIRVETGAHDTDAYLSNLNMMLSEQATVHSLPGLEILADRVRCSHGSASAPMDPEQLFYLLSRGIDEAAARSMLAQGFLADVWAQFHRS